jgi:hypothetical protein
MAVLLAEGGRAVQRGLHAPASVDSETTYITRERKQRHWNAKPLIAPDEVLELALAA